MIGARIRSVSIEATASGQAVGRFVMRTVRRSSSCRHGFARRTATALPEHITPPLPGTVPHCQSTLHCRHIALPPHHLPLRHRTTRPVRPVAALPPNRRHFHTHDHTPGIKIQIRCVSGTRSCPLLERVAGSDGESCAVQRSRPIDVARLVTIMSGINSFNSARRVLSLTNMSVPTRPVESGSSTRVPGRGRWRGVVIGDRQ